MAWLKKNVTVTSFLLVVVGPLAVFYTVLGLVCLVYTTNFSFPFDLRLRWVEQGFLYQGLNPQDHGHPDSAFPDGWRIKAVGGSYPPWSYATAMMLLPPLDWPQTRLYFALVNTLAMALIGYWAYRTGRTFGPKTAALFALSIFAMFPYPLCLSYGQYAVFIMACLVGCLYFYEKGYDYAAGICLGLALIKPQLAGLFLLPMLVNKRPRVIVAALGYLLASSCLTWALTGSNPITMFKVASQEAELYSFLSQNPLSLALKSAIGFRAATACLAVFGSLLCIVLVWKDRTNISLLRSFAICAIISMFWSYRRQYDCVLLSFPLVELLLTAYRRRSRLAIIAFCLLAGSAWIPVHGEQLNLLIVQLGYSVIWVIALVVIIKTRPIPTPQTIPPVTVADKSPLPFEAAEMAPIQ